MRKMAVVVVFVVATISAVSLEADPQSIGSCKLIDKPGAYQLAKNIQASGKDLLPSPQRPDLLGCIVIATDFVTLDLGGYTISGPSSDAGILGSGNRGVSIANGTVTAFRDGVFVLFTNDVQIHDVRAIENTRNGILLVAVRGALLRHNIADRNSGASGIAADGRSITEMGNITTENAGFGLYCSGSCLMVENMSSNNALSDIVAAGPITRANNNPAP